MSRHLALFHNLPSGGAIRMLYEQTRVLAERGYTLDLFTPVVDAETSLLASLCQKVIVRPMSLPSASPSAKGFLGTVAYHLAEVRQARRLLEMLDDYYRRLAKQIDAGGYEAVYVHPCQVLQSPALLRFLRTPSLYLCQDTLRYATEWAVKTPDDYDTRTLPLGKVRHQGHLLPVTTVHTWRERLQKETTNVRAATKVLANSYYSREAILREYGVNASVCYAGVRAPSGKVSETPERDWHEVVAVGIIAPHKRYDFLIRAVATIPDRVRPRLTILGYAPPHTAAMCDYLKRLAESSAVKLSLQTEVSDLEIKAAYARAGVVAFAPYLEPFGLVLLEAMATGAPVVGIREGGVREIVQDGVTGLLADRDEAAFGEAIASLLANPTRAMALGKAGQEDALERWTWEASADRVEEMLDRITKRH